MSHNLESLCFLCRCLDPTLTVAAALSGQSPFRSPPDARSEAAAAQRKFMWGKSDHLAVVKVTATSTSYGIPVHARYCCSVSMFAQAYDAWASCGSMSDKRRFCKDNFLSFETMQVIHETRRDLASVRS